MDVQLAALATEMRQHHANPEAAVARLLTLIRQIEAGPDYAASQAFARAAQALLQALAHGNVDQNTLNRLLQAMQQALAQHIAALAQPSRSSQGQMHRLRQLGAEPAGAADRRRPAGRAQPAGAG